MYTAWLKDEFLSFKLFRGPRLGKSYWRKQKIQKTKQEKKPSIAKTSYLQVYHPIPAEPQYTMLEITSSQGFCNLNTNSHLDTGGLSSHSARQAGPEPWDSALNEALGSCSRHRSGSRNRARRSLKASI